MADSRDGLVARGRPCRRLCGLVDSTVLRDGPSPTAALLHLLVVCAPDTCCVLQMCAEQECRPQAPVLAAGW